MPWPRQCSLRAPPSSAKAGYGMRSGSTANLSTNIATTLRSRSVSTWRRPACRCGLRCLSRTFTLGGIPHSFPKRRWTRSTTTYPYATCATRNLVMNSTGLDGFRAVSEKNPSASKGGGDSFVYWPIIVALGWPVALVLVGTGPDPWGVIAVLAVLLLWVVFAVGFCI